jgi:hypothetical protein
MNEKKDRRSERTRQSLSEALVELIREKDYQSISVGDIIERANVGRSTFYAHFRDKDDLFLGNLDEVIDFLGGDDSFPLPSLGLFQHIHEEYGLYKALTWGPGIDLLVKHIRKSLSKKVAQNLQKSGKEFNVPVPVLANYITGSFLSLLQWWLDNKMVYPPEQMDAIFKKLTLPGMEEATVR